MALKAKSKVKASKKRVCKTKQAEELAGLAKVRSKKLAKKATLKSGAGQKCEPVKRSRIGSNATGLGDAGVAKTSELDPFEVAKQTMKGSVPAIVKAMVELAKQGSCSHAKTLLEMTGAKHMFEGDAEMHDSGEPWAKLVLERLGEAELAGKREKGSTEAELARS